ncbi:MAG: 6-phosphofructokinase [Candidatus Methylacidiphilales bacterium]|nr:ATP-dependent 6-phosphofructokinase [Candidatus Methylacidiphilales bacterium]
MSHFRVGILTSGGDCPGLNAVIRAAVFSANTLGWEVVGFSDGYEGMLCPVRYRMLDTRSVAGIMASGGTILGTTNKGRFVAKKGHGEKAQIPQEVMDEAIATLEGLNIGALITIGGDGSLSTAMQLAENGIKVVGVPKTIDNDLNATAMTFGFDSAVQCVAEACDRLHTTAKSHRRVMVVEVMGRYAGWIALHGGVAGGADIILLPEMPFNFDKLEKDIQQRFAEGALSVMVVVAEGAFPAGQGYVTLDAHGAETKGERRLGGVGNFVSDELARRTGRETRAVVLGHLQRGGNPTTLDRILGTRFGVAAVQCIKDGHFGCMVSYQNYQTGHVPISEAVGQLKQVSPSSQMVSAAKAVGICFGD